MKDKSKAATPGFWVLVWGIGLAGQLCWNMENQWFNTFVYAKIAKNSNIIAAMVITSAIVTTLSTFIFGTLSDRAGQRRRFVSIGHIVWGVFTIAFGLTEFIANGTIGVGIKLGALAAVLVVLADDFMSFFGSMSNDSGFNAWTNDNTTDTNRGQIGAALAVQPVIGTILGTVLGGMLIGSNDNYQRLFWVMGGFVIIMGIISLIFMKDVPGLKPHKEGTYWQQFAAVFNLKALLVHKELLRTCAVAALFFIPFNIYFGHLGNWMIYYLGFTPDTMGYVQGGGLIVAMILPIIATGFINRNKTPFVTLFALCINIVGLIVLFSFVRPGIVRPDAIFSVGNIPLFVGMFLVGGGYILIVQSITMWIKSLYPEESRGQFEGVRIVAFTLLPMVFGTSIGNVVVRHGAGTTVNAQGIVENIPTESIFFWGAVLMLVCFIPLRAASKYYFKRVKQIAP